MTDCSAVLARCKGGADRHVCARTQTGSSLKPTQIRTPPGSLNQIPGSCIVEGDVRFTPFYTCDALPAA